MHRIVFIFFCVLPALAASAADTTPAPWGLEQLMQQRAQIKSSRANFIEVHKMPSVDMTTTTEGILIYEAPDRLERQTSKPFSERVVIQGERMTLDAETASGKPSHREFALADVPGLRPFFAALRALLAGDLDALQRQFQVSFAGGENEWQLKLVPRAQADRHVRDIVITGRASELLTMAVHEKNGDSSRTTLIPETPSPDTGVPAAPDVAPSGAPDKS